MNREPIGPLITFTDAEFDLLTEVGVRDLLTAGPQGVVYEAVWSYGVRVRTPARLAALHVHSAFGLERPSVSARHVRAALLNHMLARLRSDTLTAAAGLLLSGQFRPVEGRGIARWSDLPAELRAKARASWVERTQAHLAYASGRIARLGRIWHEYLEEPISAAAAEEIAEDLVAVGRWKAVSDRAARRTTEALLADERFLFDRVSQRTRKRLAHPACDSERELVFALIRSSARAQMFG